MVGFGAEGLEFEGKSILPYVYTLFPMFKDTGHTLETHVRVDII